ncbi:hypothetical protein [Thermoactinomyces mirandus]|uniref:Uncharacterized protein n=1 Tax=Thermoactinomyces mirandus TaxID=2756294 RepID=A0A7W1XRL4_9BACL|nr:hypothetical protein [Thermoactinomyces mirandus]MBA4601906.1 hypothetical protein [Thermoactinomyces mirandus]
MEKGETWYGRNGTPYEGVKATIDRITARKVSISYDRIVHVDGSLVCGQTMYRGEFQRMFDPVQQLELDL